MLITLNDYAKLTGKRTDVLRRKCLNGDFKTAKKIGIQWFIDDKEVFIDKRRKEFDENNNG